MPNHFFIVCRSVGIISNRCDTVTVYADVINIGDCFVVRGIRLNNKAVHGVIIVPFAAGNAVGIQRHICRKDMIFAGGRRVVAAADLVLAARHVKSAVVVRRRIVDCKPRSGITNQVRLGYFFRRHLVFAIDRLINLITIGNNIVLSGVKRRYAR